MDKAHSQILAVLLAEFTTQTTKLGSTEVTLTVSRCRTGYNFTARGPRPDVRMWVRYGQIESIRNPGAFVRSSIGHSEANPADLPQAWPAA